MSTQTADLGPVVYIVVVEEQTGQGRVDKVLGHIHGGVAVDAEVKLLQTEEREIDDASTPH